MIKLTLNKKKICKVNSIILYLNIGARYLKPLD